MNKFHVIDSQGRILFTGSYKACREFTREEYLESIKEDIKNNLITPVTIAYINQKIIVSPTANSDYAGLYGWISNIKDNEIYICLPTLDGLIIKIPIDMLYERL